MCRVHKTYPARISLDTRMAVLRLVVWTAAASSPIQSASNTRDEKVGLTIVRIVTNLNGLLLGGKLLHGANRSKDLLFDDLHILMDIRENSRLDVVPFFAVVRSTSNNCGTRLLALIDASHDAVKLNLRDLRTLERLWVERVTNLVFLRALLEKSQEFIIDGLMNKDTRSGGAALPVIKVGLLLRWAMIHACNASEMHIKYCSPTAAGLQISSNVLDSQYPGKDSSSHLQPSYGSLLGQC